MKLFLHVLIFWIFFSTRLLYSFLFICRTSLSIRQINLWYGFLVCHHLVTLFLVVYKGDYTKAFNCVDHNKLRKALKEKGIADHLTCLLRNLHVGGKATVRTLYGRTDWFRLRKECDRAICCHRLFFLYANLDSIVKSTDITLPAKVHLVKAMVFPVVMYGCEGRTIKKAKCRGPALVDPG